MYQPPREEGSGGGLPLDRLASAAADGAVAHCVRTHGIAIYFAVAPDLLDHLRATYALSSPVSYAATYEGIRTVRLLVIDDRGAEAPTPWAAEKLYQLLNHRYIYRLPTVVTTNRDLDTLEGRLASRLTDGALCTHVRLCAGDYRRCRSSRDHPQ